MIPRIVMDNLQFLIKREGTRPSRVINSVARSDQTAMSHAARRRFIWGALSLALINGYVSHPASLGSYLLASRSCFAPVRPLAEG
jgi:hypothetical protein